MILHFDFSTGASGDKLLASLLEVCEALGVASFADVQRVATALVPEVEVTREQVVKSGIAATQIRVSDEPHAPHRHWSDIRELIELAHAAGTLGEAAQRLALDAFAAVADAEAAVHGVAVEQVHFHEVGAADSIVDIVCTSYLLAALAPQAVFATPLALGNGMVLCAHGELPVPAPATARLIEGLPVYASTHPGELTTPTGAALARVFVTDWLPLPLMAPSAQGYGAGSRELPGAANVVRTLAGEAVEMLAAESSAPSEWDSQLKLQDCLLLETNIDHLSAEALAFACEELMATGALDVWQEPIVMKKGRLATKLNVLVALFQGQGFVEQIMALTGSLGVRRRSVQRVVAAREIIELKTPFGLVPFKVARFVDPTDPETSLANWLRPEHDAVARIAREQGLNYSTLYDQLQHSATLP
jgi:uncharacterized protein (TIGR00299 family) protein